MRLGVLFPSSISEVTAVFLDDNHTVKLGDFGLSKALAQASFANTYVGVGNCDTILLESTNSFADSLLYVSRAYARESL